MKVASLLRVVLLCGLAAAAAAHAAPPELVVFRDPVEGAFTVKVPKGWSAAGGTRRAGAIDPRSAVEVRSGDGSLHAFVGDAAVGMYQVPDPVRLGMGMHEGQVLNGGPAQVTLMRYATGQQYAQDYIRRKLCRQPRIVSSSESPDESRDLAARVMEANRAYGPGVRVVAHVGRVGFVCGEQVGSVTAGTALASPPHGGIQIWVVPVLAGFVANRAAQADTGKYVMDTLVASFRYESAWQARFNQETQRITGQTIADQNKLLAGVRQRASQQLSASSLNHPNTFKPHSGAASPKDMVTGNMHVCDSIGRCDTVSRNRDAYYIDHSGNVRGTGGPPPDTSGVWSPMHPND